MENEPSLGHGGSHHVSPELCLSRLTNIICLSGRALSGVRRLLLADAEEGGSDGALQRPGGLVLPPGATHHPVSAALERTTQTLPEPQIAQDTRGCQL